MGRPPKYRFQSIPTCCGIQLGSSSPIRVWILDSCNTISATRTFSIPSDTASFSRIGFETSGKTERRSEAESYLAQSFSASRVIAAREIFHLEAIRRAAGTAGGILCVAIHLWDFCDTWQMFSPDHIAGRFSCSDVAIRTRGGVRMGVETILLIVILTFLAGFVLDQAMIRRFDAEKSKTKL